MSNKLKVLLGVIALAIILVAITMTVPKSNTKNPYMNSIVTERVIDDFMEVGAYRHSLLDDPDHTGRRKEVYDHIEAEITEFGLDGNIVKFDYTYTDDLIIGGFTDVDEHFNHEQGQDEVDETYTIKNISTEIPGESDTYILYVAHYDSSIQTLHGEIPGSRGTMSGGYGVITLLETMRQIKEDVDNGATLKNGIKFLFTDGKEVGNVGITKMVQEASKPDTTPDDFTTTDIPEKEFLNDINLVINWGNRGNTGPVQLVDTTMNNGTMIDLYKSAQHKISYSLGSNVYDVTEVDELYTNDLAPLHDAAHKFMERKNAFSTMSFAAFGDISYYDDITDNPLNVDIDTVQHYLTTAIPMAEEYTSNADYGNIDHFEGATDSLYWTITNFLFVEIPGLLAIALFVIIIGLIIVTEVLFKEELSLPKIVMFRLFGFAFILASILVTLLITFVAGLIVGDAFSLSYMPHIGLSHVIFYIILIGFVFLGFFFYVRYDFSDRNMILSTSIVNFFVLIVCYTMLRGAAFVFLIPGIILPSVLLLNRYVENKMFRDIVILVGVFFLILLLIPATTYMLEALTFGGSMLVMFFSSSIVVSIIPLIHMYFANGEVFSTWNFGTGIKKSSSSNL